MISRVFVVWPVVFSAAVASSVGCSAEISAERSPQGAVVKIDGQLFTEYLVRSGSKPILWPVIGPTGKPMTRAYPMQKNSDEQAKDHPHHRSIWFGHGNVNGCNFWDADADGRSDGVIEHLGFTKIASGKPAVIAARNAWLNRNGQKLCEDERTLRFDADGDARWIDFDITIKAGDGPVVFADTKEAGFGVRVADTMRTNRGGQLVNSERQSGEAALWGKPAAWVDYHGPVDGQTVGIAILSHPAGFRSPPYWVARGYGLCLANPFGLGTLGGGSPGRGQATLPVGEKLVLRYRVLLHRGDEKTGKVAESFAAYARE